MKALREVSVCERVKAAPMPPDAESMVGLALATLGSNPINGMRIRPTEGTNGWYIWCGNEASEHPNFYQPLHVEHLPEYLPLVMEYLALPPGYRFLIDDHNYEDVWFDEEPLQAGKWVEATRSSLQDKLAKEFRTGHQRSGSTEA